MKAVQRFDHRLNNLAQKLPASWRPAMVGLSVLGHPVTVLTIGVVSFATAVHSHQLAIEHAFFFGAVAYAINTLLKLLLHRRRPHNLNITTLGLRSYSFPSGHAFGTVIFYGLFSYLDYTHLPKPWNLVISVALWAFIAMIGISRVYLKSHYPSDVIGGWILGLVSLLIIVRLAF